MRSFRWCQERELEWGGRDEKEYLITVFLFTFSIEDIEAFMAAH